MDDTTRRPLGRKGDFIYRGELDLRIENVNARIVEVAISNDRLRKDAKDAALLAIGRDEALGFGVEELAQQMDTRIRALEARTLSGRIKSVRAWWQRTLAALREPFDAFPIEPTGAAITPPPVAVPAVELRRILWTGDPDCLPEDLRMGYHDGNVTRIDKALPIRNGDGNEQLCRVGDCITVAANGDLGVETAEPPKEN